MLTIVAVWNAINQWHGKEDNTTNGPFPATIATSQGFTDSRKPSLPELTREEAVTFGEITASTIAQEIYCKLKW
jgi:hypothetical protein